MLRLYRNVPPTKVAGAVPDQPAIAGHDRFSWRVNVLNVLCLRWLLLSVTDVHDVAKRRGMGADQ